MEAGSTHRLYLPSLDGARGMAILFVLLDHLSSAKIIPFQLRGLGTIGVYLFFSLSAFLLTAPFWLKTPESLTQWKTWSTYFWRRFLRIYPLYLLALITQHFIKESFSWREIRDHLLLREGQGIFWALEVETKYYLILPLMILIFIVAWRRNAILGALCTVGFIAVLGPLFRAEAKWWSQDGHLLGNYFWVFFSGSVVGSLFALRVLHPMRSRRLQWICEVAAICSFSMSFVVMPGILQILPPALAPSTKATMALPGVFWAVFILTHLHGVGVVKYLFELRPLRYLGFISYSVYLSHKPVIHCFWLLQQWNWLPWLHYSWQIRSFAIMVAIIAVATLSFFFVERPLSKLKAGFTRSV